MNIISVLSIMLSTAFFIGAVYNLTRQRKSELNVFSFLVLFFLGIWSFANAFFFSAQTKTDAWMWHHIASIGWTGFIAETTYYFVVLTGLNKKMKKWWIQVLFYLLPTILIIYNLFGSTTSLAQDFVKSKFLGEWSYVNSVDNIWLWLYIICLFVYFGFAFIILYRWAKKVMFKLKKVMAITFIILDAITILIGLCTDVIFPLTNNPIPSVANLGTALFGVGYFFIVLKFDVFNVRNVVSDRDVIEHSMEALLVTDEAGEILDFNPACLELFETEKLTGTMIDTYFPKDLFLEVIYNPISEKDEVNNAEIEFTPNVFTKKQLMISASVIRDRFKEYHGTVFSLKDITQMSELRDQYRKKSDEYQMLAFVDVLTGLPNRRKTFEYLNEYANKYKNGGSDFFVMFMDMDNFKLINDRYGHNYGDLFLKEASKRLSSCLDDTLQFLGRLSGDEFLFVGISENPNLIINELILKTEAEFNRGFVFGEVRIHSGISIGYANYSVFRNIDAMIHYADDMMYKMKQKKKVNR